MFLFNSRIFIIIRDPFHTYISIFIEKYLSLHGLRHFPFVKNVPKATLKLHVLSCERINAFAENWNISMKWAPYIAAKRPLLSVRPNQAKWYFWYFQSIKLYSSELMHISSFNYLISFHEDNRITNSYTKKEIKINETIIIYNFHETKAWIIVTLFYSLSSSSYSRNIF